MMPFILPGSPYLMMMMMINETMLHIYIGSVIIYSVMHDFIFKLVSIQIANWCSQISNMCPANTDIWSLTINVIPQITNVHPWLCLLLKIYDMINIWWINNLTSNTWFLWSSQSVVCKTKVNILFCFGMCTSPKVLSETITFSSFFSAKKFIESFAKQTRSETTGNSAIESIIRPTHHTETSCAPGEES